MCELHKLIQIKKYINCFRLVESNKKLYNFEGKGMFAIIIVTIWIAERDLKGKYSKI